MYTFFFSLWKLVLLVKVWKGWLQEVSGDFAPDFFEIDMSQPANIRWSAACEDKKQYALQFYDEIFQGLSQKEAMAVMRIGNDYLQNRVFEPYKSEIEYFSQCIGIPQGDVMMINLLYDITAYCTSIVAENADGTIIHGRNLDYEFPLLRNATISARFTDGNNNTIYFGTTFFGYLGMWTGFKPLQFSLSGDERDQGSLLENLEKMYENWMPTGWLMRDVLTNATDYDEALYMLTYTPIDAPVYYILGGLTYPQGAVVTRNQSGAVDVWQLADSEYGWYLVETNYDHWLPPPPDDDRLDPAIKAMDETGQSNLTYATLFDVLSVHPVYNNNTLYTTIMSASNATYYHTIVRTPLADY